MPRAVVAGGLPGSDAFPASQRQIGADVAADAFDHKVTILRDQASGTNTWNTKSAPSFQPHLSDIACLAATGGAPGAGAGRLVTDGRKVADIIDRRVFMPLGTDVMPKDRLSAVTDADDVEIFSGPMSIESVNRRASYIELIVERIE